MAAAHRRLRRPTLTDPCSVGSRRRSASSGRRSPRLPTRSRRIGPPPIDGGDEAFDEHDRALSGRERRLRQHRETSSPRSTRPTRTPSQELTAIFTGLGADLEESAREIDETFSSPEMEAAFEAAPECDGVDMGQ